MADFSVEIKGLSELNDKLVQAGPKLAKRALRRAGSEAGELVRSAIAARAPVLQSTGNPVAVQIKRRLLKSGKVKVTILAKHVPGFLKANIAKRITFNSREDDMLVQVGPRRAAFYGGFAELGTRHQKQRRFMLPAWEATKQAALDVFVKRLTEEVEKLDK